MRPLHRETVTPLHRVNLSGPNTVYVHLTVKILKPIGNMVHHLNLSKWSLLSEIQFNYSQNLSSLKIFQIKLERDAPPYYLRESLGTTVITTLLGLSH